MRNGKIKEAQEKLAVLKQLQENQSNSNKRRSDPRRYC
jgi:hypothetical protein